MLDIYPLFEPRKIRTEQEKTIMNSKQTLFRTAAVLLFIAVFAVVLFSLIGWENTLAATTITVDDDGGADYEKIQDAVDNASEDGDTIRVYAGTYYENVLINTTLTLIGNGSKDTTIDGGRAGNVVRIEADWVNMSGVTITGSGHEEGSAGVWVKSDYNSINESNCSGNDGRGIALEYGNHNNTITNNTCSSNRFSGISLESADSNILFNNNCSDNEKGISLFSSGSNTLSNNTCVNNKKGIYFDGADHNTLSNNTCSDNKEGIYFDESDHNTLFNNTCSDNDYAIRLYGSDHLILSNNTCSDNQDGITLRGSYNTCTNNTCVDNHGSGIYLWGSYNTIYNNTCTNNYASSISLRGSYSTIYNNTCENNQEGIRLSSNSNNNTVVNNICNNNSQGIELSSSPHNTVVNNICNNNSQGIELSSGSDNNTLSNNTCSDNGYGIRVSSSSNTMITGNLMIKNGISISGNLEHWNTHTIDTTNTVNGKPVRYYKNLSDMIIPTGAGQVILANCTNIMIEDQNLSNGTIGICIGYSSHVTISNNTCSNNKWKGISLSRSDNNTLLSNTCFNNSEGITIFESNDNVLSNNTCSNNTSYGIRVYISNRNTLANNTCSGNNNYGVTLNRYSNNNTITNNTISDNNIGIRVGLYSRENVVHYNHIYNNIEEGIDASNNKGYMVNATKNWWGRSSGPYHAMNNTEGQGDNVTDYVAFEPWYPGPTADILGITPTPAHEGQTVSFSGKGTGWDGITTYTWSSSLDGELYDGSNSAFQYGGLTNGTHIISLKVRDGYGIRGEEHSQPLIINGLPRVEYLSYLNTEVQRTDSIIVTARAYDNEDDEEELTPTFEYRPPGGGWASEWFFNVSYNSGEGRWEATFTPPKDTELGFYDVRVMFTDMDNGEGDWLTEDDQVEVTNNQPTEMIDSMLPNPVVENDVVRFEGNGTDVDGIIVRYCWRTNEGVLYNGSSDNFSHPGFSRGTYTIYFSVQDDEGAWSGEINEILIVHTRPTAMIASISPSPALDTDIILFKGNGTDDGTIKAFNWRIVNGTGDEVYNGSTPPTTLPAGTYTLYFKVQDNYDVWSDEVSETLVVHEKPSAFIDSISPNPVLNTKKITFRGHGEDDGEIVLYVWRSSITGELHNGTAANFTATLLPGTHTITLAVMDDLGAWSDEANAPLLVHIRPTAAIASILPPATTVTKEVQFTGGGVDDWSVVRYAWRSSLDGEFYNGTEPTFKNSTLSPGTHTIYLKVRDKHGAWSTEVSAGLELRAKPTADISPLPSTTTKEGKAVRFTASPAPGVNVARYVWTSSIDGELYNGTGASFRTSDLSPREHTITLRVEDEYGVWSQGFETTLTVEKEEDKELSSVPAVLGVICVVLVVLVLTTRYWYPPPQKKK